MRLFAVLIGVFGLGAPALAEESLILPVPEGFALAQEIEATGLTIRDYMPEGQTGADWQEFLSVQAYAGLTVLEPDRGLTGLAEDRPLGCSAMSADLETYGGAAAGLPIAVTVMTCPQGTLSDTAETLVTGVLSRRGRYLRFASCLGAAIWKTRRCSAGSI